MPTQLFHSNTSVVSCTPKTTQIPQCTKGKKRKAEQGNADQEPWLGLLGDISNTIKAVGSVPHDKISKFSQYIEAEIRDLPSESAEEFMDETVIRLLQTKRKHKKVK